MRFHLRTGVEAILGKGQVEGVRAGGETYPADLALVGIGVVPNEELAREAGLGCDGRYRRQRIRRDRRSRHLRRRRLHAPYRPRRPSGASRMRAERHRSGEACRTRHDGQAHAYKEVPWFWSDQYDLKLQIAGLAWPDDQTCCAAILRPANSPSSIYAEAALPAVEAVNAAPEYLVGTQADRRGKGVAPKSLQTRPFP